MVIRAIEPRQNTSMFYCHLCHSLTTDFISNPLDSLLLKHASNNHPWLSPTIISHQSTKGGPNGKFLVQRTVMCTPEGHLEERKWVGKENSECHLEMNKGGRSDLKVVTDIAFICIQLRYQIKTVCYSQPPPLNGFPPPKWLFPFLRENFKIMILYISENKFLNIL